MRRFIVAVSVVGALLATGGGVAMANGHNDRGPGPRGHHQSANHHPRGPAGFHHRAHRHLTWWEQLRLRLHHNHR